MGTMESQSGAKKDHIVPLHMQGIGVNEGYPEKPGSPEASAFMGTVNEKTRKTAIIMPATFFFAFSCLCISELYIKLELFFGEASFGLNIDENRRYLSPQSLGGLCIGNIRQ